MYARHSDLNLAIREVSVMMVMMQGNLTFANIETIKGDFAFVLQDGHAQCTLTLNFPKLEIVYGDFGVYVGLSASMLFHHDTLR